MSIGRVRPTITSLPAYRPGKAAEQAEQEHNIDNAIKLASNENPFPPHPAVVEAITNAAATVNRYPDHLALSLRAKIGAWVGVDAEAVTVGTGSVGLLRQLAMVYIDPGDEAVYPWISFEAYPIAVTTMGGVSVQVPLDGSQFDLNAVGAAVTDRTKMIFLATPNNPTGTAVTTTEIGDLVREIPDDVIVVVDEAYREFVDPSYGDPVQDLLPHHPNVVVLRTFSKAYGLAGLRSGYMVAHPDVIVDVDKTLLPFTNNQAAQAAAIAAIDVADAYQPRVQEIRQERGRMVAALAEMGVEVPDAQANFVWIPLGDATDDIYLNVEKQGVVTRPFSGVGMRVTIGTTDENDRFLKAFAAAVNA